MFRHLQRLAFLIPLVLLLAEEALARKRGGGRGGGGNGWGGDLAFLGMLLWGAGAVLLVFVGWLLDIWKRIDAKFFRPRRLERQRKKLQDEMQVVYEEILRDFQPHAFAEVDRIRAREKR